MQILITPVAVFPATANTLYIRAGNLGPPPTYYYQLTNVTEDGVVTVLKDGNVNMTDAQWADWQANLGTIGDEEYQLNCIAANLGLTRA
jgi:hypothetical protein